MKLRIRLELIDEYDGARQIYKRDYSRIYSRVESVNAEIESLVDDAEDSLAVYAGDDDREHITRTDSGYQEEDTTND